MHAALHSGGAGPASTGTQTACLLLHMVCQLLEHAALPGMVGLCVLNHGPRVCTAQGPGLLLMHLAWWPAGCHHAAKPAVLDLNPGPCRTRDGGTIWASRSRSGTAPTSTGSAVEACRPQAAAHLCVAGQSESDAWSARRRCWLCAGADAASPCQAAHQGEPGLSVLAMAGAASLAAQASS